MNFSDFLLKAKVIVSEHRAQYIGVYVMKGGGVGNLLGDAADIATAVVAPEFLPVVVAGTDLAEGKGLKNSLIGGAEALGGQELAGAVGIGSGNDAFNSALGITGDTPAGTGLPDVGSAFSNALGGAENYLTGNSSAAQDLGGSTTSTGEGAGVPGSSATTTGPAASGSPTSSVTSSGSPVSATDTIASANQQVSQAIPTDTAATGASTTGTPGLSPSTTASPAVPSTSGALTSGDQAFLNNATSAAANTNVAGAATPAASSGGLSSLIPSGKTALASAIPLGELAYNAIKGPAPLPSGSAALEQGGAATAPLLALEKAGANEATTGQLTAPQQATINNYIQQAQNQLISQLAGEGVTDPTKDSRYIQGMQQIQQEAIAQAQQYITAAIGEATSAGGAASGNLAAVANQQIQNDNEFQNSLTNAFGSLGSILGGVPNIKIGNSTVA